VGFGVLMEWSKNLLESEGGKKKRKKNPHMGNNDKKHESVESGDSAHENELMGTFKDYVHVLS
jgi:hypothetical protein